MGFRCREAFSRRAVDDNAGIDEVPEGGIPRTSNQRNLEANNEEKVGSTLLRRAVGG